MFDAVLKTPVTTAGHGGRDRCGRSSLLLSEPSRESITVDDGELVHRLSPFPDRAAPVGGDIPQRHPDQLGGGFIAREATAGPDDPAQPCIDALDRIWGVDHATYSWGNGKERNDPIPGSAPQRRDGLLPLAPGAVLEFLECLHGSFRVGRGVDRPQRLGENLAVLPARVLEAVADLMDDACLPGRRRECRSEGLWNALEAIGDGDQDVPDPAGLEVVDDLQPELRALGVLNPDPQDVARAVTQYTQRKIRSASRNATGYIGSRGQLCQALTSAITASVMELMNSGETSVPYCSSEKPLDLPHRHAAGAHGDDLVIETGEAPFVLGNQHRFEAALTITGNVDPQRPVLGQHRLGARPIALITRLLGLLSAGDVAQVVRLCPQAALDQGLFKRFGRGIDRIGAHRTLDDLVNQF